jgi:hypothetical protein
LGKCGTLRMVMVAHDSLFNRSIFIYFGWIISRSIIILITMSKQEHFFTHKEFDTRINLLENSTDFKSLDRAECKLCGFCPNKQIPLIHSEVKNEIKQLKYNIHDLPPIDLSLDVDKYIYGKMDEKYKKFMKENEVCTVRPKIIKTRDMEFINFLIEQGYKISSSMPIGRSNAESSSSSETSSSIGFFSNKSKSKSSSYSEEQRYDIAEYTLIK